MITYNTEDTNFVLTGKRDITAWIKASAAEEGCRIGDVSLIFCSDDYLLQINREYLQHDYFTDIITFDYREGDVLSGDLFISLDTVRTNAEIYKVVFHVELLRVIIHGIMHLAGYKDKSDPDAAKMCERENHYLAKLPEALCNRFKIDR